MISLSSKQIWIRKFVDVCLLETQKKVDDRAGTKLRKYLATRGIFWAWSQSSCRLFSEFLASIRAQIFWFKFEVVSGKTVVNAHRTVLMEWWWCLVTCSRPQVVLERSCGCGWVGGLINGTHKCYNMIMMRVWGREWAEKMCQKYTKNY